jgi:hypothetical protein
MMPPRAASSDWPRLLTPAPGCLPPAAPWRREARVLHIALRTPYEKNPGMERDLRGIAQSYAEVDWAGCRAPDRVATILAATAALRPTLIFMQLQCGGVLDASTVSRMRALADPTCVIVNWDGDQHHHPGSPQREWFAQLGRACDASLIPNTRHPEEYARLGAQHPGYLQVGYDPAIYRPVTPAPPPAPVPVEPRLQELPSIALEPARYAAGPMLTMAQTPPVGPAPTRRGGPAAAALAAPGPIVLLANHYGHSAGPLSLCHARRSALVAQLKAELGEQLGLYGASWPELGIAPCSRGLLPAEEAPVYGAAAAALAISIVNNLPRYTSDRLLRMLGSGALCLVEEFPDYAGLGLEDGVNCLLWRDLDSLRPLLQACLKPDGYPAATAIRVAAVELAQQAHTWAARFLELLAIVDAVRASR